MCATGGGGYYVYLASHPNGGRECDRLYGETMIQVLPCTSIVCRGLGNNWGEEGWLNFPTELELQGYRSRHPVPEDHDDLSQVNIARGSGDEHLACPNLHSNTGTPITNLALTLFNTHMTWETSRVLGSSGGLPLLVLYLRSPSIPLRIAYHPA